MAEPDVEPIHLKDSSQRVVGGEVATPNSWRWQVKANTLLLSHDMSVGDINVKNLCIQNSDLCPLPDFSSDQIWKKLQARLRGNPD